ncbi:MAG: hypothetical protein CW716_11620 [Candidatus Bathyarchaeum sp.]|nr:MAG: hypothetical protein CW716_11620 [Candidatus Bathyarchaeum sp.]
MGIGGTSIILSKIKHRDSKKLQPVLSDEVVTYLDFAIRLKRSYETILKIQDYQKREKPKNQTSNLRAPSH